MLEILFNVLFWYAMGLFIFFAFINLTDSEFMLGSKLKCIDILLYPVVIAIIIYQIIIAIFVSNRK